VSRINGKRMDPRDEPAYLLVEASHYLALPASTIHGWTRGQKYDHGKRRAQALIAPAQRTPIGLSFWNLVELYVLASMRRAHHVSMPRVRRALDYVAKNKGLERPLIEQDFLTDGVDLFVEEYAKLINVSRAGQTGIREALASSLRRIERDARGLATRMFPWRHSADEPRDVEIDPHRCFGKPVLAGTGVPTGILADRFFAGDTIDALAADYRIPREKVEAAVRWEGAATSEH
jgi:uncharacterized protein (DUF433 family)